MSFADDFAPVEGDELEEGPSYPVVFGVEFAPPVQGILIGLLGLVGAFFLFTRVVAPVAEERQALQAQVAEKQANIASQRDLLQDREALEAQLAQAIEERVGVYGMLGSPISFETLLLDINRQIEQVNAGLPQLFATSLADTVRFARLLGATDAELRRLYSAELTQFTPNVELSGVVQTPEFGAELQGKLERQVIAVSFLALFDQTQTILRNLERLEPLVNIRDLRQEWAPLEGDISEEVQRRIARPISTSFILEVVVPIGDPTQPPEPPPPPPQPAEGEVPVEEVPVQ